MNNGNNLAIKELNFKCKRCGTCCKSWKGTIYISINELKNIAERLNLTLEEIFNNFVHIEEEKYIFEEKEINLAYIAINQINNICIFYDEKSNSCIINDIKPYLCKLFPFWSIIMKNKSKFEEYCKMCEGLKSNDGIHYSEKDILRFLQNEEKYLENLNYNAYILSSINESEILESILSDINLEIELNEEIINILKNNLFIEKIRILMNRNI